MIQLAERLAAIKPSPTLEFAARINQLKAQGHKIYNLTIGEPDFDTPEDIKNAANKALRDGFTKYTAVDGIPSLKQAIINKFTRENSLQFNAKEIIVSCGSKQAIYNLTQALLNPGDEVIIPAPYWVSYPEMVQLAGGVPVIINAPIAQNFKITADQLDQAITSKTKLFILNSPSNPTGIAYTKKELNQLAQVLLKHPQVIIASDEIYEHILWTQEPFVNILNTCPQLKDRSVLFNGVSKSYAMTGWRIGYAAGPAEIIRAMSIIQSQSTSNPNSIAQVAAQAALENDQSFVRELRDTYRKRHELVYTELKKISGINCLPADGTFYIFPCVQKILDSNEKVKTDLALSEYLLQYAVAVMPGTPFGMPGYLRLSYVLEKEELQKALQSLQEALAKLDSC